MSAINRLRKDVDDLCCELDSECDVTLAGIEYIVNHADEMTLLFPLIREDLSDKFRLLCHTSLKLKEAEEYELAKLKTKP